MHYCCLLSQKKKKIKRERERELNYVNLYFALLFVDYWKSLQKHVSAVRLGVVVEVVCLALWLLMREGEKNYELKVLGLPCWWKWLHCCVYLL